MIFNKILLVQGIIISVISIYIPQCGLDNSQKDYFYNSLINAFRKFGEKQILVILRGVNAHVGRNLEGYEDKYGGYDYGVRNKEVKGIVEFFLQGNTLFKKRASHHVNYISGLSNL